MLGSLEGLLVFGVFFVCVFFWFWWVLGFCVFQVWVFGLLFCGTNEETTDNDALENEGTLDKDKMLHSF